MSMQTSSSIERTLALLEVLLDRPQGVELAELLMRVDISRSALFVLLNTLKQLGYVAQAERRGRYRAGPRLLAWRGGWLPAADLQAAFYQEAQAANLPETLALAWPTQGVAVLVAQVEPQVQVRSAFPPAFRFSSTSAVAQVLCTIPSSRGRSQGYVFTRDAESVEVALPICADGHTPTAALLLSAPAFRWSARRLREYVPLLREIAARLSYRMGAMRYAPWQEVANDTSLIRRALDPEAMRAFLAAPWVARLACLRPDGAPHVVPVWQEWDGTHFFVAAWQGSLWAEYVLDNPNVSLSVDEPWPPLRCVIARGRAFPLQQDEFPGGLSAMLHRLRRRYLGAAGRLPATHWRAFRIVPNALIAWQGLLQAS